jgi:Na+-translocating ferredoxin:NAD+ oxidoreductase subunit B
VDQATCIGCMACKKACPADAIVGERKNAHYIIVDRCIGCGACADTCPKHSIALVA